jgi:O-antigen/teichoic acid export membrane protein
MSLKNQLIKDTFLYGAGDILTKLIAFLLIPLYTTALSPAEYGVYQLLVLFVTISMIIGMTGMNVSLFKHFVTVRDEEHRRQLFSACLIWVLISSGAIIGLAYVLASPLSQMLTGVHGRGGLVGLSAINAGLDTILLVSLLIFRMEKKPAGYVGYTLAKVVIVVVTNFILLKHYDMGVSGILIAGIVADILILAPLLVRIGQYITLRVPFRLVRSMLLWGIPFVPASFATVVLTLSDRLLLRYMDGFDAAGIYSVGYKIAGVVFLLYTAFRFAWGPYMFELAANNEIANRTYPKVLTPLVGILSICAVGIVGISPELFELFVGEAFHSARIVLVPVSLAAVFEAMNLFFGAGMQTRDRTIYIPIVTGFAAILNVLLNIWLIPRYGFVGAAWATLVSYIAMAFMSWRLGNPLMPVEYPWTKLSLIIIIAGSGIAGCWFLAPVMSRIGVIIASAVLILWVTGAKPSDFIPQNKGTATPEGLQSL